MLYKKNVSESLSDELFADPTSEYRCTPFWAWNCKLDTDLLDREIDAMKEMGMGGFHMHSRTGMATDYMSDDFLKIIRHCVEKAKKEDMYAYLYDEDRWPSGFAGGIVTREKKYRAHSLLFTPVKVDDVRDLSEALDSGKPYFLAAFDVTLDGNGMLESYKMTGPDMPACGDRWYAYLTTAEDTPRFNDQAYVDTLSKEAIDRFIDVTHEAFYREVGDEFDKAIPSIFTDEPQFDRKETFNYPTDKKPVRLPWTPDLDDTFAEKYGYPILSKLPELFWDLKDGKVSEARYRYHDHVCQRFTESYSDNCGIWCEKHGIALTGHMMEEPTLFSQTSSIGEAMRSYRHFGIPGIDMLCNYVELSTAKQCQSAVHQYGREGMLSELYGVTDWNADFRLYKFSGDWQAALGVTVRVPHLFWTSMHGEAKRDYPASIGYQSPWYKEYSYIEDHFARLNTALTRGKPCVRVGVIHPIESYWLHFGPKLMTESIRSQMDGNFKSLIRWLLSNLIDFDFICESLLPEQVGEIGEKLPVGQMEYDTVVVPELETMRSSTLGVLKEFSAKGGRIIFLGACPTLVDAVPSDAVGELYEKSEHIGFDKEKLISSLEPLRFFDVRNGEGKRLEKYVSQLRDDNGCKWLYIAQLNMDENRYVSKYDDAIITLYGEYTPVLYDTLTGKTVKIPYKVENGRTVINRRIYSYDSVLLKLLPKTEDAYAPEVKRLTQFGSKSYRGKVWYERSEPNVLLLDTAEYRWDGNVKYEEEDEILRLDNKVRKALNMRKRFGRIAQPWVHGEIKPTHTLTLRYNFMSEYQAEGCFLALEDAETAKIVFNGEAVESVTDGYFTDESIKKVPLPKLKTGRNEIVVTIPFGEQTHTEWCYLLGEFNVRLEGCAKTVVPPTDRIGFGSVTEQGLPFYGGNIDYKMPLYVPEKCTVAVKVGVYIGAAVNVSLDGKTVGSATFSPNTVFIPDVKEGCHMLTINFFGNRFNCFGALHNSDYTDKWVGPAIWRTGDDKGIIENVTVSDGGYDFDLGASRWCDEYRLKELGVITSPTVFFLR